MTQEQAMNMLRFIADLYKVVNAPAPPSSNGHAHVAPEDVQSAPEAAKQ